MTKSKSSKIQKVKVVKSKTFKKSFVKANTVTPSVRYTNAVNHYGSTYGTNSFLADGTVCVAVDSNQTLSVACPTAGTTSFGSFSLCGMISDLPAGSDYSNMYDQYAIVGVKAKIIPVCTVAAPSLTGTSIGGQLHTIIDYDDYHLPTANAAGLDLLRQNVTYKTKQLFSTSNGVVSRYWKPRVSTAMYDAGNVEAAGVSKGIQWIDFDSPNVIHSGLKGIFEIYSDSAVTALAFKVELKYYVLLRNQN